MSDNQKSAKRTASAGKSYEGFTDDERDAMKERAKAGKIICFFQSAAKFKSRYATFGFNEDAKLDEGTMWPTSFALTELTAVAEARIAELVKKAVS